MSVLSTYHPPWGGVFIWSQKLDFHFALVTGHHQVGSRSEQSGRHGTAPRLPPSILLDSPLGKLHVKDMVCVRVVCVRVVCIRVVCVRVVCVRVVCVRVVCVRVVCVHVVCVHVVCVCVVCVHVVCVCVVCVHVVCVHMVCVC